MATVVLGPVGLKRSVDTNGIIEPHGDRSIVCGLAFGYVSARTIEGRVPHTLKKCYLSRSCAMEPELNS